jgi:hypothetical protein
MFVHERLKVTGDWRKLHDEELRDMYSLPSMTGIIKSRMMMIWAHVTYIQSFIGEI